MRFSSRLFIIFIETQTVNAIGNPLYLIEVILGINLWNHRVISRNIWLKKDMKEKREFIKEKIPCEGESVLWSDPWAGLIASCGSFYPMVLTFISFMISFVNKLLIRERTLIIFSKLIIEGYDHWHKKSHSLDQTYYDSWDLLIDSWSHLMEAEQRSRIIVFEQFSIPNLLDQWNERQIDF